VPDPEDLSPADRADLEEREADVADQLERERPVEADDADVYDQRRDVPDAGEDDYPG
jgi:hypothetical protein